MRSSHRIRVWHLDCDMITPERRERQIEAVRQVLGWTHDGEYDDEIDETIAEIVDTVNGVR